MRENSAFPLVWLKLKYTFLSLRCINHVTLHTDVLTLWSANRVILINSILLNSKPAKIRFYAYVCSLLSILTRDTFRFNCVDKFSIFIFTLKCSISERISHRLASGSIHWQSCFSFTDHILLIVGGKGHNYIMI